MQHTHTHTHTRARKLGEVRGRQRRGKTTTQIAAGRHAAEYIFDEWTACCTLSTLLILMAPTCNNKSVLRQVMAQGRWRLHTHVNTPSRLRGMRGRRRAEEGVKAHRGREQQPNSLFWLNFKCLSELDVRFLSITKGKWSSLQRHIKSIEMAFLLQISTKSNVMQH